MKGRSKQDTPSAGGKADAILDAAAALFSESGFDGVSMSAVAAHAGVSKANVFHHFGSKEELYVEVIRRAHETFAERLRELADDGTQDLRLRLGKLARAHIENILEHEDLARLFFRELLSRHPAEHHKRVRPLFEEHFARFTGLLRDGQRRGELRDDFDPAVAVSVMVGANLFLVQSKEIVRHYPGVDFADSPARYVDEVADIVWRSLARRVTGGEPHNKNSEGSNT